MIILSFDEEHLIAYANIMSFPKIVEVQENLDRVFELFNGENWKPKIQTVYPG